MAMVMVMAMAMAMVMVMVMGIPMGMVIMKMNPPVLFGLDCLSEKNNIIL